MISHPLLLSGSSFSVESTDSRWDNMKRTFPAAEKNNTYCPTAAPRENPGKVFVKWSSIDYHGKINPITSSRRRNCIRWLLHTPASYDVLG